jgi:RNA polymerase sigma-70 factor (ECF subfamily)
MPLRWRTNRQRVAEALVEHLDTLFRVALRLTGDAAAAEDLVQETCLRAYQAAADLRQVRRVKSWLITILTHRAIDAARWRARQPPMLTYQEGESPEARAWSLGRSQTPPSPEHIASQRQTAFALKRALDELPVAFRLPVFLVYVEGLSYQEVAESLDCPLGTVMSRLARGKALLRQRLRELEASHAPPASPEAERPCRTGRASVIMMPSQRRRPPG